ncbi:MAG: helix-turn-helix family protein [Phenylobacterium sp.]|nr:helix-turn-helix family protein [Phenylobacterium sp.]
MATQVKRGCPPPVRIRTGGIANQAEDAAVALRNRLGVGLGPIGDLFTLFELDLGVRVFHRALPHHTSGLYAFDPAVGACILINSSHRWKRRVQTLAHEGGHFVADRSHADINDDRGVPLSIEERFARRFGPALLMPAATVRTRRTRSKRQCSSERCTSRKGDESGFSGLVLRPYLGLNRFPAPPPPPSPEGCPGRGVTSQAGAKSRARTGVQARRSLSQTPGAAPGRPGQTAVG